MTLGIFLSSGESFKTMARSGQDIRYKEFYLKKFSKDFKEIYIFSYANETVEGLPKNVIVVPNKYKIHRFLYMFLLPIINLEKISKCDGFRVYHLLGTIPSIITKIFFNKPYIFNYSYAYGDFAKVEKKWLQYVLLYLIKFPAIHFASYIIVTLKKNKDRFPSYKSIFIPNGVDINIFIPERKVDRKIPVILSVGRLEEQKNYKNLILGLKDLNVKLLIVGDGSQRDDLINFASKINVELKIIKKVENTKLPEVYNSADIFVLPSYIEGPSKVMLEAMACQLPVVGSNVDGLNELIIDGKTGLLCTTRPQSIKENIQYLISDNQLSEKIAKNAREKIAKEYNLDILLEKEINSMKMLSEKT